MEPSSSDPDGRARLRVHRRLSTTAGDLLGYQGLLRGVRLLGVLLVLVLATFFRSGAPWLLPLALLPVVLVALTQHRWLHDDLDAAQVRRRSLVALAADSASVYLVVTAFVWDPIWLGFTFLPLVAIEAGLVAGGWAVALWTATAGVVYLIQMALRAHIGYLVEPREIVSVLGLYAVEGAFFVAIVSITRRVRDDLGILLELTAAIARQRTEGDTLRLLDDRLEARLGSRVRSLALREPDGSYVLVRGWTTERRRMPRSQLESVLPNLRELETAFSAGQAVSLAVRPGDRIGPGLGLPDWVRLVTFVPISVEQRWIGVLPILWPSHAEPTRRQLDLLHVLADHAGLAFAQTQLRRARREAVTDPLTRLLNRRALGAEVEGRIAVAAASGEPVAVLFCDLDGFKAVNDRHGHDAGDDALREVARAVSEAVREGDAVGRYGGDELAIVAADLDEEEAVGLAERVRAAVRSAGARHDLDVTVGIAVYPRDGIDADSLLAAADEAMYRGKAMGTGRVVVHERRGDDRHPSGATPILPG